MNMEIIKKWRGTVKLGTSINTTDLARIDSLIANAEFMDVTDNVLTDAGSLRKLADEQLWCVHIQGPDDIIPFASKNEADMEAAKINKSVGRQWEEGDPEINAVVVLWPGGPESHAVVLERLQQESV